MNPQESHCIAYTGGELEMFSQAGNWRQYWQSQVACYVAGNVLEVGAGIGSISSSLYTQNVIQWLALEPDCSLYDRLARTQDLFPNQKRQYTFRNGTLFDVSLQERFNTILYIDVLEHIEEDRRELEQAAEHLMPEGHLIILVPAHPCLYTEFDAAIGHFRRYTRKSLLESAPRSLSLTFCRYLDMFGMLLSLGNRFVLHSPLPTQSQIAFWDTWIVPLSARIDPLLRNAFGKSLLAVWRKPCAHH